METTTIRVSSATRDRLKELARRRGAPAGEIVAELVQEADDRALLAEAEENWKRLADDPQALAAYRDMSAALTDFDSTPPEY